MITEKFNLVEIARWMCELRDSSGIPDLYISIHPRSDEPAMATVLDFTRGIDISSHAQTFEEAIGEIKKKLSPSFSAQVKRDQARKLLAEASVLNAETTL